MTIQRKFLWLATAAFGLLSSASAMALENGFYLGLQGGQTSVNVDPSYAGSFSIDDSDSAFGIVLGGQFGRWFALEAQLISLGKYQGEMSYSSGNYIIHEKDSVEAAALALSGILSVPLGEHFAIGARLGFAVSAAETTYEVVRRVRYGNNTYVVDSYSGSNEAEASDVDATFGLSFEWDPTRHFGLRLDYQRFNNVGAEDDDYDYGYYYDDEEEHAGADLDLISLSLIGRF